MVDHYRVGDLGWHCLNGSLPVVGGDHGVGYVGRRLGFFLFVPNFLDIFSPFPPSVSAMILSNSTSVRLTLLQDCLMWIRVLLDTNPNTFDYIANMV